MKTKFLLLWLFPLQLALAQNTVEQEFLRQRQIFGIQLGFNHLRLMDRNSSSLIYRGNIPTLGFSYEGLKNGNLLLSQLQLGRGSFYAESYPGRAIRFRSEDIYGNIDSVSVPMRGSNTLGRIALGYVRQIDDSGPVNYGVGAMFSDDLYYPQGFAQPGLMNVATVSPIMQIDYSPTDRQFFSIRISVPLISLVSRSTYNNAVSQPVDSRLIGFFDQGTQWESFRKHRQIDLSAAYHFKVGDRWMTGVYYKMRILKNTVPRDLTILQNELGLSMQVSH